MYYVVDSHCDSIQAVDKKNYGIVNPYNYSKKYQQLQFVALFFCWPNEDAAAWKRRAIHYYGQFKMAMEKEADKVVQVRSWPEIEAAIAAGKHAALLTIEGGIDTENAIETFRDFYTVGVRVFGLAWSSNGLAMSNRVDKDKDTGLSEIGREIVAEGNRLGMIFDVSHLSDKSFWDLAEISKKPIIATHSNFRSLCSASRNLTDEMAKEIVRQDGMIGLNLCTAFIHDEGPKQTVENYFKHLEYALPLIGEDHIGFGGDVDGIDDCYPAPLTMKDSIHDQLIEFMLRHNYSDELVKKVAGGNYLSFLKKYL